MHAELLYQIALTLIPNVGPVQAKNLMAQLGSARAIFTCPIDTLKKIEGIGELRAAAIRKFNDFNLAEQEMKFIQQYQISPLFINDPAYPKRLLHCYDCPTLLYYKGSADLNNPKTIAVIGTRTNTEYGRIVTDQLIEGLSSLGILVVSGLAHGIDAIAHRAALKNGLPTVGVLAHGLSQVYPAGHTSLAREIVKEGGGLLTEFRSPAIPDRHQFPARNRIVAGMTDATVVVETGVKGGSIITAELANGYNRDVFAFPGKISDPRSAGCNHLIRCNKAGLISDAASLLETMNWGTETKMTGRRSGQKAIFIELTKEEQVLADLLRGRDAVHIDEINLRSGLPNSVVAAAILNMELQNLVLTHPGKRYSLY
ncbi:DNA-processing protein DprA [Terrimonas sp. NA20]|uniref:DNA-processing protein DprA n=1 Tax=Terrimonas ginsenosidimutans TaxID=2908004 RepID=A0ABS9KY21_9BACT|nr:DNA-processing protein DprA [Terrimonas ginsenosidimutans]MCG2617124.1 DNA-processing protein DprA [Terrimonas ginsenosidimutans]